MLVYTLKVFDTVVVPGTTEECDPALWSELARASDFFGSIRASAIAASTSFYVEPQSSSDGRRWTKLFDMKSVPTPGATRTDSLSAFPAPRASGLRRSE